MNSSAQLYLFETPSINAPKGGIIDASTSASIQAMDGSWGIF